MDPETIAVVSKMAATLLPVAALAATSCWTRIRKTSKIKKHVLVMPSKAGKTHLASLLQRQRQVWCVDVDEKIKIVGSSKQRTALDMAARNHDHFAYVVAFNDLCDIMMEEVRAACKASPGLRAVFITSSWDFAQRFRKDAILTVCQDSESFALGLSKIEDTAVRDLLRQGREDFLATVPKEVIQTYPNLSTLEEMVRSYLSISRTV